MTSSDSVAESVALDPMLVRQRERVIERLGANFINDFLSLEELDQRLSLAFKARSYAELQQLVANLPEQSTSQAVRMAAPDRVPERGFMAAVMGGSLRGGSWLVPRHLKVFTFWGGAGIDLRQARLAPGITEIEVYAIMGGAEIIVPPGVRVETDGVAIMGGFEATAGDADALGADVPTVRISGLCIMGGVDARAHRSTKKALARWEKSLKKARRKAERG
jgi:Domain of unknown function (DUF1707)/Cell wall-active antibiotics response 4TMS YvqF